MHSILSALGNISLTPTEGEQSMGPFDLTTLAGLPEEHKPIVANLLRFVKHSGGTAYFTLHGKKLKAGQTLRRPGAHTDGNYEPVDTTFGAGGGGGWKIGENGPGIHTDTHRRQYLSVRGGIILTSNISACRGWAGQFDGTPRVGGDCSHLSLGAGFMLAANTVYYGNNHFIHESLPVAEDCHRVFARITMPEDHVFTGEVC